MAETYATDIQTGAIKLSKGAEVTIAPGGDICSAKVALYRASGADWGSVYASTDGDEWQLLQSFTSGLTAKETNYIDVTVADMRKLHYKYLRIEQKNGASPTYLAGIALTYMKKDASGIETVTADETALTSGLSKDLMGRTIGQPVRGQFFINGKKKAVME